MSRGRNDVPEFLVGNILNLTTIMRVIADTSCDWLFSARTTQWISTITVDIASFFSHVAASFSSAFGGNHKDNNNTACSRRRLAPIRIHNETTKGEKISSFCY